MPILDALISPIAGLIDKIIPDPRARDAAKLELLKLQGTQDMETIKTQMAAIIAEAESPDPWTSRARPSFLYVMYTCAAFVGVLQLLTLAHKTVTGDATDSCDERQNSTTNKVGNTPLHEIGRAHV